MSSFVSQTLRMSLLAAGLAISSVSFSPVMAQTATEKPAADAVIAKGNGFTVTEKELAEMMNDPSLGADSLPEDQKREALINYLIDLKAVSQLAAASKLDQAPEFAKKIADLKQQLLVQTYLDEEVKKLVTPEEIRKLYDETTKEMKPVPEVRARHILVKTEDEAKAVVARLKKGDDFAKVAAELSQDPGSKDSGGELGFFSADRMVAPFSEAAFKLEPKQISAPVKSDFGWHVIEVEEKRNRPVPSYDELKPQIEAYLTRQSQQKVMEAARATAKVERLDKPAAEDKAPADSTAPKK
ncbi:peptidylprolyl isomerase [Microvirga sp. W0021]|uniref:Parvulin-like PPIase n=1 Tax=Hohaiivirga grylli TaxID=3133970 RepID=A0ABV0BL97_9HYPH